MLFIPNMANKRERKRDLEPSTLDKKCISEVKNDNVFVKKSENILCSLGARKK